MAHEKYGEVYGEYQIGGDPIIEGRSYVASLVQGRSNEDIMQMIIDGKIHPRDPDVRDALVHNLLWLEDGRRTSLDEESTRIQVSNALDDLLTLSPPTSYGQPPFAIRKGRPTSPFGTRVPGIRLNLPSKFTPSDHPDYKKDMERRLPGSERVKSFDGAFLRREELLKGIGNAQVTWGLNWKDEPSQVVELAWLFTNDFDVSWDMAREEAEKAIADSIILMNLAVWNDVAKLLENLDRNVTLKDVPKDRRVADPEKAKDAVKSANNKILAAVHMDNIRLIEDALADPASYFMADRSDDFKQEEIRRLNLEVESLLGGLGLGMAGDPAMREEGAIDKKIDEILAKHDLELEPYSRTITDPDTGDEERITGLYEQPLGEGELEKATFIKLNTVTGEWDEGTVDQEGNFKSNATGKDVPGEDAPVKLEKKAPAKGELPLGVTLPQIREKDVSPYTQYSAFLSDELADVPLGSGLRSYYEGQYDPLFKQFELQRAIGKYPAVGDDIEGLTSFQRFITDPETSLLSGDERRTLLESALGAEPVEAPYGVEGWLPFAQSLGGGGVYGSPEQGAERALEFAQWAAEPDIPYALREPFRRFGKRKFEEYRTESPEKSFLDEYIAREYKF